MPPELIPILSAVAGVVVGAVGAGRTLGTATTEVAQLQQALKATEARVAKLEEERLVVATERGATGQRLLQAEATLMNVEREVVAVEARINQTMEGMEKRLIAHMDRMVSMVRGGK